MTVGYLFFDSDEDWDTKLAAIESKYSIPNNKYSSYCEAAWKSHSRRPFPLEDFLDADDTELNSMIHANTESELNSLRSTAISWVFNGSKPSAGADNKQSKGTSVYCNPSVSYDSIERLDFNMADSNTAYCYLVTADNDNNKLVLLHEGHANTFNNNGIDDIADTLLELGYNVCVCYMPLLGQNTGPASDHDDMANREAEGYNPISTYLEPCIRVINEYADYDEYIMMGVSGGGWTTMWMTAIETRISKGFDIAGNYPWKWMPAVDVTNPVDRGDYEQGYNSDSSTAVLDFFHDTCSQVDLYLMAAQREYYLIRNKIDSCCFYGERHQMLEPLETTALGVFETYSYSEDLQHVANQDVIDYIISKL